jgi:DNA-binding MarR family transcriptional regulator
VSIDAVRGAFIELLGAERRLRARDPGRPGELSHGHLRALMALARDEEATAGALAKGADVSPASMTAMLDQLERDGIVVRRRSEHDRRQVLVSLTDAGHELIAAKRATWDERWAAEFGSYTDDELAAAARVMRTVAAMLDGVRR